MSGIEKILDKFNNVDVSIEDKDIEKIDSVISKNIINLGLMLLISIVIIIVVVKKVK